MFYIGCHQTNNLNDGYLGSGKHLKSAINKYGVDNFIFEILHSVSSKEEMFELERSIVNESLVKDPMSYNLKIGGSGGNPGIIGAFTGKKHTPETKEKLRKIALAHVITEETREKCASNSWAKRDPEAHRDHVSKINKGIPKTQEHKEKLRQRNLGIRHKIVTCPHCGKTGGERAIKRWHFDNCKNNASEALR